MDLSLLVWALIDKNSSGSTYYYFSVFNLNNWYSQCMPSKMKQLCELNVDGSNRIRKNVYFLNYSLPLNCDLESLKVIQEIRNLFQQRNFFSKIILFKKKVYFNY